MEIKLFNTYAATLKPGNRKDKSKRFKASPNKSVQIKTGSTCSRGGTEENQHTATSKHGNQAAQHIYIYHIATFKPENQRIKRCGSKHRWVQEWSPQAGWMLKQWSNSEEMRPASSPENHLMWDAQHLLQVVPGVLKSLLQSPDLLRFFKVVRFTHVPAKQRRDFFNLQICPDSLKLLLIAFT